MASTTSSRPPRDVGEFDYVIVGAGSAGCVLANRLSEDGTATVCLIEAGERATGLFRDMPIAVMRTWQRPDLNWGFKSESEPGLNGRIYPIMRGKALGGTSQINGMEYVRGDRRDFDAWEEQGCSGWAYEDVLPYFRRSETSWDRDCEDRGDSGPLQVNLGLNPELRLDMYEAASAATGFRVSRRIDRDELDGLYPNELTVCGRGRRSSTWRAYLKPALRRRNLHVVSGAHGCRVLLDGRAARGFEFEKDGVRQAVRARKEVILSGGAFGSPQLLLLSGIGPAAELSALGITPVHDLPGVGRNLNDHPMAYMCYGAEKDTYADLLRMDRAAVSYLRWLALGTGPFATNGFSAAVYYHSDPAWNRADVQLAFMALDGRANLWWPFLQKPVHGLMSFISGLRADSRGSVTLRSADPMDSPKVMYNLLTEQSDVDRMIRGIRKVREIYGQAPLSDAVTGEFLPGPDVQSDADLTAFLRNFCYPGEHVVATCTMGSGSGAVVDPKLRVNGIDGLRVVDASVMPLVPTANTNATTIMIAEKASDHIRGRL